MRYGILADLHGNLEATTAVIEDAKSKAVDNWIVLGDIVGYGPNPNEVMDLIYSFIPEKNIVAGNHDEKAVLFLDFPVVEALTFSGWSPAAAQAIHWTARKLFSHNAIRLRNLVNSDQYAISHRRNKKNLLFVHSSPHNPKEMEYIHEFLDAQRLFFDHFSMPKKTRAFVGHVHIPQLYAQRNGAITCLDHRLVASNPQNELSDYQSVLTVCPSVGQPRDRNPDAGYVVYDSKKDTVDFVRVKYDPQITQKKIFDEGLPLSLGKRLIDGGNSE